MVGTIHYERHAGCNLAEFSDNQSVTIKIVVMQHVLFKVSVAEVCKIAYYYVGILNGRSDIGNSITTYHGKDDIGVWCHRELAKVC